MCNISRVAIIDRLNDLSPQELRLKFGHLSIWLNLEVPMQATSIDELHDQEHLLMTLKGLIQLRNVNMIEFLHDFHLSLNTFPPIRLHQF